MISQSLRHILQNTCLLKKIVDRKINSELARLPPKKHIQVQTIPWTYRWILSQMSATLRKESSVHQYPGSGKFLDIDLLLPWENEQELLFPSFVWAGKHFNHTVLPFADLKLSSPGTTLSIPCIKQGSLLKGAVPCLSAQGNSLTYKELMISQDSYNCQRAGVG